MQRNGFIYAGVLVCGLLVVTAIVSDKMEQRARQTLDRELITATGVCPPFHLYDEEGAVIDPLNGINADKPYSPRQTCGKCHDYDKITEGYHFQQGKDETATGTYADRYQWVSHPGNYGGNWCSPAPLYNYLSKKENTSAKEMDMTSFTFITKGCGTCHPGGGSFEFDRNGRRYDKEMERLGYAAGGDNDFDGDYYKAHWNRSGVGEGDCMLCHFPSYGFAERNKHLLNWNFRWMATAGSGLARVEGSVKDNQDITVTYDLNKFDKEGKLSMHLVREPRNETCLHCHSKPQWKKRGASFTAYTDVHIAKGIKCVDCHPAGSMAFDPRIKEKEAHQLGKGDDPSGMVRNDLDNTMRTCKDCHITGYLNAPIAKHAWLPPLHLDKLACQACHIPERKVKSALVQVSDVYNPGTKIRPPAKYIWTFYDQKMNYWNRYGEGAMFTNKDQPSDPFIPLYAKYKGQIFPVNAVHSAWPAIFTEGKPGLHQPKMQDIYNMWAAHRIDNTKYPALAQMLDDNTDLIPEVNRPEEIDALISSVTEYLTDQGYDLSERRIVWVNNDRMYFNSREFVTLEKEVYEASPYASVYKYNHDVFPAKAGLGAKGCTECHSFQSNMFYAQVVQYPFGEDGQPVTQPQYKRLGMSGFFVFISAFREQIVKSVQIPVVLFLVVLILISLVLVVNAKQELFRIQQSHVWMVYALLLAGFIFVYLTPGLNAMMLPERLWFERNHFLVAMIPLITGIYVLADQRKKEEKSAGFYYSLSFVLVLALVSGLIMLMNFAAIEPAVRIAYTLFDICIVLAGGISVVYLMKTQTARPETV